MTTFVSPGVTPGGGLKLSGRGMWVGISKCFPRGHTWGRIETSVLRDPLAGQRELFPPGSHLGAD